MSDRWLIALVTLPLAFIVMLTVLVVFVQTLWPESKVAGVANESVKVQVLGVGVPAVVCMTGIVVGIAQSVSG